MTGSRHHARRHAGAGKRTASIGMHEQAPARFYDSPTFTAPPRQSGRLAARERRNTRPAYSPKVFYFAGRPTWRSRTYVRRAMRAAPHG